MGPGIESISVGGSARSVRTDVSMNAEVLQSTDFETLKLYCDEIESRIRQKKLKLPVLPHAIQKVLAMNGNPDFRVEELSQLIHRDHTLAGHVLKVSNSTIYGGTRKTTSLSQAIARLGRQAMVKIAVSITMQGEVFQVVEFKEDIRQIWYHSVASAVYAQEIAVLAGRPDPEMYMCGLIHQVGKPVLLQTIIELSRDFKKQLTRGDVKQVLDRYHSTVGGELATCWNLPAAVVASCMHYLKPAGADEAQKAVYTTCIASRLADAFIEAGRLDLESISFNTTILENAGLKQGDISILVAKNDEVEAMIQAITI